MSRAEFAKAFHIPLAVLREWEHHFQRAGRDGACLPRGDCARAI